MELVNLWRIVIMMVCGASFSIMLMGYKLHRNDWNKKTRDYWYGRVMWVVTGFVIALEGILEKTNDNYSLVFVTAAALATLKGNLQKGRWGNDND